MKYFIGVIILTIAIGLIVINTSDAFSTANCTAAKLHQEGKLKKVHLMLAPDYARRTDIERLVIQQLCKMKS